MFGRTHVTHRSRKGESGRIGRKSGRNKNGEVAVLLIDISEWSYIEVSFIAI